MGRLAGLASLSLGRLALGMRPVAETPPESNGKKEPMVNRFVLNTISYHGSGAIKEIPGELSRCGLTKAFVCSDPDLV